MKMNKITGSKHVGAQFIAPTSSCISLGRGRNELRPYMPGNLFVFIIASDSSRVRNLYG